MREEYKISRAMYMSATELQQLRVMNEHHLKMLLCVKKKENSDGSDKVQSKVDGADKASR